MTLTDLPPRESDVAALEWVDPDAVRAASRTKRVRARISSEPAAAYADLLGDNDNATRPRRATLAPIALLTALVLGYVLATLAWPLGQLAPQVTSVAVGSSAAPMAAPAWPAEGSAGLAVSGLGSTASSSTPSEIASITKVVTVLVVLEELPLELGEQGEVFEFTWADRNEYWRYLSRGESALEVPFDATLTQYQMMQAILLASANNYADRLAGAVFDTDEEFAGAAARWLETHGVSGVTVVEPTGFDSRNVGTNAGLLTLSELALAHPVVAEIVAQRSADLPGVGEIENTNVLLEQPGYIGIKTGSLSAYALIAAKTITVDGAELTLYGSVLDQPTAEARWEAMSALFTQAESELSFHTAVPSGTQVGTVTTRWGERAMLVTTENADVVLWNGGVASVHSDVDLGDARHDGDIVGTLTATAPVNAATVDVRLDGDLSGPSAWWRLTHPLQLWGLAE